MVKVVGGPVAGANVLSLDPSKAAQRLGALYYVLPSTHTGAKLVFDLGVGTSWTMTGTGFGAFDANGVPHSGTITGMSFMVDGALEASFANLKLSMKDAWTAITAAHSGDLTAAPKLLAEVFAGADTFTSNSGGSAEGDTFLGQGGNDTFNMANSGPGSRVYGGDGNDTFNFGAKFQPGDIVDGGAGADALNLDGGHTGVYYQPTTAFGPAIQAYGLNLEPASLTNVEKITLAAGSSYGLIFNDANVAHGAVLTINGAALAGANSLYINGAQLLSGGALDVTGGAGADTLIGGAGNDTLNGGAGNDLLDGGRGNDVLSGGAGTDTATYADATAGVDVSLLVAKAQNTQGAGTDTLTGIENLTGSNFADWLAAGNSGSVLNGGAGPDILLAGAGNDTLIGGGGDDEVNYTSAKSGVTVSLATAGPQHTGGSGTDTLIGINVLEGSNYSDVLTAGVSGNALYGAGGDDTLIAGTGTDYLDGGAGADTAAFGGGASDYVVTPTGPNLTVAGDGGNATVANVEVLEFADEQMAITGAGLTLTARAGGDRLIGGSGNDHLNGGAGNDVLVGAGGADVLNGGGGTNTADFAGSYGAYTVKTANAATTVKGPDGTDTLTKVQILHFDDAQVAIGSTSVAMVADNNAGETLIGGSGNDVLYGAMGNDVIIGGGGQDQLAGGDGIGGEGHNTFVFTALSDSLVGKADRITEWTTGDDRIDVSAIDADSKTAGNQAFHFGATAGHTGDIVVTYDAAHNRTVVDLYVNSDAKPDAEIWLSGHQTLSGGDFVL